MKVYFKKMSYIFAQFSLYILFFLGVQYFFKNELISVIIIPIYFLFYLVCFLFFYANKMKLDGRIHLFWILSSAVFYLYIFKAFGMTLHQNDYVSAFVSIILLTCIISFMSIKEMSKKTHLIFMIIYMVLFASLVILAILLNQKGVIWLYVLLAFKMIPYAYSYHLSKMHAIRYEKIYFFIYFFPLVASINLYSIITGTCDYIDIKKLLNSKDEERNK